MKFDLLTDKTFHFLIVKKKMFIGMDYLLNGLLLSNID